jgi:hypothetical protein
LHIGNSGEFIQNARPQLGREGAFIDPVDKVLVHKPLNYFVRRLNLNENRPDDDLSTLSRASIKTPSLKMATWTNFPRKWTRPKAEDV